MFLEGLQKMARVRRGRCEEIDGFVFIASSALCGQTLFRCYTIFNSNCVKKENHF